MKKLLLPLVLGACSEAHDSSSQGWESFEHPGEPVNDYWIESYGVDPSLEQGHIRDYFRLEGFDPELKEERMYFFSQMELCWAVDEFEDAQCGGAPDVFQVEFADNDYTAAFAIELPQPKSALRLAFISEGTTQCLPIYDPLANDYYLEMTYLISSGEISRHFSLTL